MLDLTDAMAEFTRVLLANKVGQASLDRALLHVAEFVYAKGYSDGFGDGSLAEKRLSNPSLGELSWLNPPPADSSAKLSSVPRSG